MKTICDANIILRYLIHDEDELYNDALKIIEKSPYVSLLVLSEVVYVLKGVYKISKNEIVDSLMALTEEIQFEDSELMIKTLENFKELNLDFVDCYLLARNQINNDTVITFDNKLNNKLI